MTFYEQILAKFQQEEKVSYQVYEVTLQLLSRNISVKLGVNRECWSNKNWPPSFGFYFQQDATMREEIRQIFQERTRYGTNLWVIKIEGNYYEAITGLEIPIADYLYDGTQNTDTYYWLTRVIPPNFKELVSCVLPWNMKLVYENISKQKLLELFQGYHENKRKRYRKDWKKEHLTFEEYYPIFLKEEFLKRNQKKEVEQELSVLSKEYIETRVRRLKSYEIAAKEEKKNEVFSNSLQSFEERYLKKEFPTKQDEQQKMLSQLISLEKTVKEKQQEIDEALVEKTLSRFEVSYLSWEDSLLDDFYDFISFLPTLSLTEQEKFKVRISNLLYSLLQAKNKEKVDKIISILPTTYFETLISQCIPQIQQEENFQTTLSLMEYLQKPTEEKGKVLLRKMIFPQEKQ